MLLPSVKRRDGSSNGGPDSVLLRPGEARTSTGLGLTKARQHIAAGELDAVKIGAVIRVPRASIEAHVERLRSPDAGRDLALVRPSVWQGPPCAPAAPEVTGHQLTAPPVGPH